MKKIRIILLSIFIGVLVSMSSCTTFKAENLAVLSPEVDVKILGHFERTVLVSEFLGVSAGANIFNITADAMSDKVNEIVWQEILKRNGNGAINVQIEYSASFLDQIGNYCTGSIWAPAHLKVSGDVIRTNTTSSAMSTKINVNEAVVSLLDSRKEIN